MLYLVKKVNVEFQVLEESTGLNIFSSPNPEEAEKMRLLLNSGSGFDGNTPTFFVKAISQ
tara:strand:+ start:950 stop:1129 length:180 start_codon:yes stop_codon:yes gene_type:complete